MKWRIEGYRMQPISLEKSQAFKFIIEGDTLIPPFISVPGLGENVAKQLLKLVTMAHFYQRRFKQKLDYLRKLLSI